MSAPATPPRLHRNPFEHVFVATDFSLGAAQAVGRAGRLPLAEGARISIVHVLPGDLPQKLRAAVEREVRRRLAHAAGVLSKCLSTSGRPDIVITSELCRGQAYVEIVRRARSASADLVVLGRHGRRPVKDMFVGSTAQRVVRAGDLPVLIVGRKAARAYRRLLLAVDLEDTARSVIEIALRVGGPGVEAATLVHAYNAPFEGFITPAASPRDMTELRKECRQSAEAGLARLRASIGDPGLRWQTTILRGDPRSVILAEAERRRVDLLAVGTHGRTGLVHALIGSVAERIVDAAACDVLVARPARVAFELP